MIYSCNLKGDYGVIKTVMHSFNDAINGIAGKAPDYKIYQRTTNGNRVEKALKGAKNVIILYNGDMEGLGNIIRNIKDVAPEIKIAISLAVSNTSKDDMEKQYPDCDVLENDCADQYDRHFIMCEHVFKITEDMPQDTYIDAWCNIIFTQRDYVYASSFEQTKELFLLGTKELLLHSQRTK